MIDILTVLLTLSVAFTILFGIAIVMDKMRYLVYDVYLLIKLICWIIYYGMLGNNNYYLLFPKYEQ